MAKQEEDHKIGDLVWAKLKGFPLWPGKIISPSPYKKGGFNVFFFGTHDKSAVQLSDLHHYEKFRKTYGSDIKMVHLKKAFKEAEEYLETGGKMPEETGDQGLEDSIIEDQKEPVVATADESVDHDDETAEAGFEALVTTDQSFTPVTSNGGTSAQQTKRKLSGTDQTKSLPPKKKFKLKMELGGTSPPKSPAPDSPKKKPAASSEKKKTPPPKKATPSKMTPPPVAVKSKENKSTPASGSKTKSQNQKTTGSKPSSSTPAASKTAKKTPAKTPSKVAVSNNTSEVTEKVGNIVVKVECPCHPKRLKEAPFKTSIMEELSIKPEIKPTTAKIGFIGLGGMASGIITLLLNSGHVVTMWNRSPEKCEEFRKKGAVIADSAGEVIDESEITFSCVAGPEAVKDIFFSNGGIAKICAGKSIVEMSGIDSETSNEIAESVTMSGGNYLEAQIYGGYSEAINGQLITLTAGEKNVFDACHSCFQAISKKTIYFGPEVGKASMIRLILQNISGSMIATLTENLALVDRLGLGLKSFVDVLQCTNLYSPFVSDKVRVISDQTFEKNDKLMNLQKDVKLSIAMSDKIGQPLPLSAAANEVFKNAVRKEYGDCDSTSLYMCSRF